MRKMCVYCAFYAYFFMQKFNHRKDKGAGTMIQNNQNPYWNNQNPYMQFQGFQPTQISNPYMERMNNLQQFQQSLQPPVQPQPNVLNGKMVDSIDVVKATDIPMDGNLYYFPKADGTEIYAKSWLSNGTTQILTFKPSLDNNPNTLSNESQNAHFGAINEFTDVFMKRFDDLDKRFDDFEQSWTKTLTKTAKSSTKKESETE